MSQAKKVQNMRRFAHLWSDMESQTLRLYQDCASVKRAPNVKRTSAQLARATRTLRKLAQLSAKLSK